MKILWIDDEPDILFLCSAILGKHGHKVYTLPDSKNLLNTISETRPDVILLDHWMPGMTGVEVARQLKKSQYSDIPIIMCTSNPEIRDEAKRAGADCFITKPFTIAQVESTIQKATQLRGAA
jgi:two-component system phosphate regulon response regulator PhoB